MDVQHLINEAGGVLPCAKRLGVARTTILDWKRLGTIPGNRLSQISTEFKIRPEELLPLVQPPKIRESA